MSFSQNTNSFYIKGVINPKKVSNNLGVNGYDFEFINTDGSSEQTLLKKDYQIPVGEKWQIALTNIKYIHINKCFSFPEAAKAKTAAFNNVYDLYSIEYLFGPLRYLPIFHNSLIPWHPHGINWWNKLNQLAIGNRSSLFNWSHYMITRVLLNMLSILYTNHYDKPAMNKVPIGSYTSPNAAPVLRANLLDVIPRFGHKPSSSGWYHLTATEFVHVLNNLFDVTEMQNANASKEHCGGFPLLRNVKGWHCTNPFPIGYA